MRRERAITSALLAVMLTGAAPTPAVPLAPTGQWLIEGQDNMCALSHAFGEGRQRVTLALRPWPMTAMDDVLLFSQGSNDDVARGTATLQVDGREPSPAEPYIAFGLANGKQRLVNFRVGGTSLDGLAQASRLTLVFDRKRTVIVAPPGMSRAAAALEKCQALLHAKLGIDEGEEAKVVTPARPRQSERTWFSPDDYPSDAVHGGAQGYSRLLFTIGVDGRVARCVTFGSSGNAAIDKAACAGFVRRGRYTPALDAGGQAVESHRVQSVNWVLPG